MKTYWSSARYIVWSAHADETELASDKPYEKDAPRYATHDVVEVRRTDYKTAEADAQLIRDTFRRKAWVQDAKAS